MKKKQTIIGCIKEEFIDNKGRNSKPRKKSIHFIDD
jgi:hypothetical protein